MTEEGLFWLILKYFIVKLNNVKMLHMCPFPNDKIVPTPMPLYEITDQKLTEVAPQLDHTYERTIFE